MSNIVIRLFLCFLPACLLLLLLLLTFADFASDFSFEISLLSLINCLFLSC